MPEHPDPANPPKMALAVDEAERVTVVPTGYVALHAAPQLMPAGTDVTFPTAPPETCTVSRTVPRHEPATQSPLVQSVFVKHPLASAHLAQFDPPQSTSVSWPFFRESSQRGAAQTLDVHFPVAQSRSSAQPPLAGHAAQLDPPQSTSVSPLFV